MLGKMGQGGPVTRPQALTVPPVLRGRNFLCSIATLPLREHDADNAVVPSPFLGQLDVDVPNVVTLSQTVEDLVFDAIGWWLVLAKDFNGWPVAVRRLDPATVSLQPPNDHRTPAPLPSGRDPRQAVVWVDGEPVAADRIIRFDSPNPPLRDAGRVAIRRALTLDMAANMYADDPRPLDYFSPAEGADPVSDDDVKVMLAQWKAARKRRSTAYVPAALDYNTVDSPSPAELQLVELQRQVTLDIANAMGLDPEDVGVSTTSRTYRNDVDRRRNKLNDPLGPYMSAITDRLSMGDVTRRGHTVRFDVSTYLQPNPTDRWAVYQTARGLNAMTVEEIREAEGMVPLPPEATDAPPGGPVVVTNGTNGAGDDQGSAATALTSPASFRFDRASEMSLDVPVLQFTVDRENRIIEGVAVPYGQPAQWHGITYTFDAGSLQWDVDNPGRVKLMFPRHGTAVGKAIALRHTPGGLFSRFKVGRGAEGDRALQGAEDGVWDGFSVGVDFDPNVDATPDRHDRTRLTVHRGDLRHVALTDEPTFDNARVTRVAASRTTGGHVPANETPGNGPPTEPEPSPEPVAPGPPATPEPAEPVAQFSAEQVLAFMRAVGGQPTPAAAIAAADAVQRPQVVDPTRRLQLDRVNEPVAYRFDRRRNFLPEQEHVFSRDLHDMALANDVYGVESPAGRRVMDLLRFEYSGGLTRHEFVITTDVDELNPTIQRPDMYVDQQDFRYPIWNLISKGAPPDGVNPFLFPKFSSSSGLVADHVEGTEPTGGTFVTTSQTVTPTAVSGKAHLTREIWDMGGNPAVSTLVFNQMVRGYREGLESAAATFLNTLTAAADIALGTAATDLAFVQAWEGAVAALNFIRGYDLSAMVVDQTTYLKAAAARDTTGRPFWPQIGPMNANGTVASRFTSLNGAGVEWLPSWALPSTPGSPNNSWLFDPMFVHGWATPPQRLEFPGATQAGAYAPVAFVDLAVWGYKALANSDIAAVRQVIYDSV